MNNSNRPSRGLVKCPWDLTPIVTIDRHVLGPSPNGAPYRDDMGMELASVPG